MLSSLGSYAQQLGDQQVKQLGTRVLRSRRTVCSQRCGAGEAGAGYGKQLRDRDSKVPRLARRISQGDWGAATCCRFASCARRLLSSAFCASSDARFCSSSTYTRPRHRQRHLCRMVQTSLEPSRPELSSSARYNAQRISIHQCAAHAQRITVRIFIHTYGRNPAVHFLAPVAVWIPAPLHAADGHLPAP